MDGVVVNGIEIRPKAEPLFSDSTGKLKKTDSVDWLYGEKEKKMDLVVVFNALRRPLTSKV